MRIFIAFPVPEVVRTTAASIQQVLQKQYPFFAAKWVPPGNMHVTLEFLGTLTSQELKRVEEVLQYQTKRTTPFLYRTGVINAFPNLAEAETLIWEVNEVETSFGMLLRKAIHEDLATYIDTTDHKLWRAHITLARIKNHADLSAFTTVRTNVLQWPVTWLELIESNLSASGSRYTTLNVYPFK